MTTRFYPGQGLVVVRATIWGPLEITVARLALDTGATRSLLNKSILRVIGYDTTGMLARTQITTGSGVESTPLVVLSRIAALGKQSGKWLSSAIPFHRRPEWMVCLAWISCADKLYLLIFDAVVSA